MAKELKFCFACGKVWKIANAECQFTLILHNKIKLHVHQVYISVRNWKSSTAVYCFNCKSPKHGIVSNASSHDIDSMIESFPL